MNNYLDNYTHLEGSSYLKLGFFFLEIGEFIKTFFLYFGLP